MKSNIEIAQAAKLRPITALAQDPVLQRARLIAEAWDSGPDGYQVGRFPGRWLEWNDKFRDTVRRYWLFSGEARGVGGIFYDHLNSGDWAADFAYTQDVGRCFLETYPNLVRAKMHQDFSEAQRIEQRAEQLVAKRMKGERLVVLPAQRSALSMCVWCLSHCEKM